MSGNLESFFCVFPLIVRQMHSYTCVCVFVWDLGSTCICVRTDATDQLEHTDIQPWDLASLDTWNDGGKAGFEGDEGFGQMKKI